MCGHALVPSGSVNMTVMSVSRRQFGLLFVGVVANPNPQHINVARTFDFDLAQTNLFRDDSDSVIQNQGQKCVQRMSNDSNVCGWYAKLQYQRCLCPKYLTSLRVGVASLLTANDRYTSTWRECVWCEPCQVAFDDPTSFYNCLLALFGEFIQSFWLFGLRVWCGDKRFIPYSWQAQSWLPITMTVLEGYKYCAQSLLGTIQSCVWDWMLRVMKVPANSG